MVVKAFVISIIVVGMMYALLNFSQISWIAKIRHTLQSEILKTQSDFKEKRLLNEINIRDPFLLKDGQGGYILTGTISSSGVSIFKSDDLRTWSGPYTIVPKDNIPVDTKIIWAPEIHEINGKYYLLVTHMGAGLKRGSYMYESDTIDGEYTFVSRVTPEHKMSLDATILMQGDGIWITYSHEWLEVGDGKICAVKLKDNLTGIDLSTDICLFSASDNVYQPAFPWQDQVTDGPWYYKKDGELFLMWSTFTWNYRYIQVLARSSNGHIDGEWTQLGALYTRDGGHGMIFTDYDGNQYLILHSPNGKYVLINAFERAQIIPFGQLNFDSPR